MKTFFENVEFVVEERKRLERRYQSLCESGAWPPDVEKDGVMVEDEKYFERGNDSIQHARMNLCSLLEDVVEYERKNPGRLQMDIEDVYDERMKLYEEISSRINTK